MAAAAAGSGTTLRTTVLVVFLINTGAHYQDLSGFASEVSVQIQDLSQKVKPLWLLKRI